MIAPRVLKISIAVLLFAFLASGRSIKQETPADGITTTMVVSRQEVLPFEPVAVLLLLRNETAKSKRVIASWRSILSIGEETENGIRWRGFRADNEPFAKPPAATAKDFSPGQVRGVRGHVDYEAPSGVHLFARPGRYLLKGVASANGQFGSEPIAIVVLNPEGANAPAYQYLKSSKIHQCFGEYTIPRYTCQSAAVRELEQFIADFDGSDYSHIARTGLAMMWLRGVEGKQDFARAQELLTEVSQRARAPLSYEAEYYLGVIATQQKETARARVQFQKVAQGQPTLYFKFLAEESLR